MTNILLLTNILPPYRLPLYNLLGKKLEKEGYKLKIAFMAENEENRAWQIRRSELLVEAIVLPGWHKYFWRFEYPLHLNWRVWKFLSRENPDVVISGGYSAPANWVALAYCKRFGKPLILWTSTTKEGVRGRDPLRCTLRSFFIKQADAFVTYGRKATEYVLDYRVKPEAVFTGCNVGDIEFFKKATAEYLKSDELAKRRKSLKKPVILYVGQFIQRKGLFKLIEALSDLKQKAWSLLLVGNGPLRDKLERAVKDKGLDGRISFIDFQEKEDLPKFYALADIFVLPSIQEPFGIVVSEALASGLFVVASEHDGASWDLIEYGKNGIIMNPNDGVGIRKAIINAIEIVQSSLYSREEIAKRIAALGIEHYASAFVEAVRYVLKK